MVLSENDNLNNQNLEELPDANGSLFCTGSTLGAWFKFFMSTDVWEKQSLFVLLRLDRG